MASIPRPSKFRIEGQQGEFFALYGRPSEVTPIFGNLELEEIEPELVSVPVSSFARRRYPGGPTSQVAGHTRQRFDRNGDSGSNATPGEPFWVETLANATSKRVISSIQMSTTAPMTVIVSTAMQNIDATKQIRTTGGRTFRGNDN